jgi:hypothetical protein
MTTSSSGERNNWSKYSGHRFLSTRGQRSIANISHPSATIDCGLIHDRCDLNGDDVGVLDIHLETTEPQGAFLSMASVKLEFQQHPKAGPNLGHIHNYSPELQHSKHALEEDREGFYKRFCLRYTAEQRLDELPSNRRFRVMVVLEEISEEVIVSTHINAILRSWLPSARIWRALRTYWGSQVDGTKTTTIQFSHQKKRSFACEDELYASIKKQVLIDESGAISGRSVQQHRPVMKEAAQGP